MTNEPGNQKPFENGVNEAERELIQAREHFSETLRDASAASKIVVRQVWQSGKPVLLGAAILTGVVVLVAARRARAPRSFIEIRVTAPTGTASVQKSLLTLAARLAVALLIQRVGKARSRGFELAQAS
ncbi:MAG: hypothetical protein SFV15_10760 [Polyangiaceae bacterium]|nr:hypothetical protein [Polyangiaceae bacterium]